MIYLQISDACTATQVQCNYVAAVLSKHSAKTIDNKLMAYKLEQLESAINQRPSTMIIEAQLSQTEHAMHCHFKSCQLLHNCTKNLILKKLALRE